VLDVSDVSDENATRMLATLCPPQIIRVVLAEFGEGHDTLTTARKLHWFDLFQICCHTTNSQFENIHEEVQDVYEGDDDLLADRSQ